MKMDNRVVLFSQGVMVGVKDAKIKSRSLKILSVVSEPRGSPGH